MPPMNTNPDKPQNELGEPQAQAQPTLVEIMGEILKIKTKQAEMEGKMEAQMREMGILRSQIANKRWSP
jgi:peptidoglycan hydrolase CwlO-like protein